MTGRRVAYVGAGIAAVVMLFSVAGALWWSPAFPAWLEATSTFAAFAAAGVAVYFVMRQERRVVDALVREQASKVAAWFGPGPITTRGAVSMTRIRAKGAERVGVGQWVVHVRNASDLPVSSVWVALADRGQVIGDPFSVGLLPPAADPVFEPIPNQVADGVGSLQQIHGSLWEPGVAIAFIDASGHGWVRGPRGALLPVDVARWDIPDLARMFGPVGLYWTRGDLPDQ